MAEKAEAAEGSTAAGRSDSSPSASQAAIEVKDLTKYYVDFLAVDNISFDVREGEILGFLGPNGAGKSTTIRILTCFMPASSGVVKVAGYDVFTQSLDVRRQIGYMPENTPLYPEMRVREYLMFRATIKGVSRARRRSRVGEIVSLCGISEVENKIIGQLSKGYRQRVGLADALIADPRILVLDEPLASLDPNQQQMAKKLIKELRGKHTIIFSTHILADVEEVADRMIIIDRGRLVGAGTPDEFARRFESERHLRIEVAGPRAEVQQTIQAVPGVKSVEVAEHDGLVVLKVRSEAAKDVREEVARAVLTKNWGLREIRSERMELAEIFARLTTATH
ncbi:MAG: ATP-binding cassette domain-containing protein [Planctomycetes bacterium]|nr:ATP-binding cassette domain-containing protein [Planctomycetota bacterium]